ncbi:MAG: 50S ribosome-binding GTPase [Acidimicrobiia bacterium]|nr:50S ribosome-binding GTPase [Acidimicrobiia bacterium]
MEANEPATRSDGTTTDLDAAVDEAVVEGLEVVDDLVGQVIAVLDSCLEAGERVAADHGDLPGREIVDAYTALLAERKTEAEGRFTRQRTRLTTFNLVLFGRTGAGKSSLIEALSSGNGEPISQGESDWTTDVRDVRWRSTRLVDTPGIGGWGRTRSRVELEARAEVAVADADVVILCFDTQSQQDGEFAKIAEWVSRYGKPVVAVLNSRNGRWRHPSKVGRPSSRRALSQTIHEHAGNIGDELARVGLPDTPVVAIHSKRAAFARTRDPYAGPDGESRRKQLGEHGSEQLLTWSNLPALELLLTEALARHAAPLRLGMLHEQARGLLTDLDTAVRAEHDTATVLAEQLERGIADVLGIVGRPADKGLAKRVKQLEKLRGGFGVAESGELLRHARHRVAAGLQSARKDALRRADRLVEAKFDTKEEFVSEEFEQEVLLPARTDAEVVARSVGAEVQQYLSQRLDLVADDVRADLDAAVSIFEGADPTAGRAARNLGVALESGSALLSIGSSTVLILAAFNSWNPVGWILWAVSIGGIAISLVGGKVRKKAAADKMRALGEARSRARRAVSDTFDRLEQAISEDINRMLSDAAHEQLAADVAHAMALRRVLRLATAAAKDLQKAFDRLPVVDQSRHLLSEVAVDLQRRRHPGNPAAGRLLWLGESWCTDPNGLGETEVVTPALVRVDPAVQEERVARVRSIIDAAGRAPEVGAGRAWISATLHELDGDEEALSALAPVWAVADDAPPRIVVAGDYSTGKSSFVKRLLVDLNLEVPDKLEVAAQPKTTAAELFRWGDWELVDTPGFQSTRADHAEVARDAVVGASLLIVLFNPNLVVGAAADLCAVLFGDESSGRTGKLPRTLFVINRSDELGIDPREDPAAYQNLCRRKEVELGQALGALHGRATGGPGSARAEQILCVASDPYGMVGDRPEVNRADYDLHRDWDGMDALGRALTESSHALRRRALDTQILEGSAAILGDLIGTRRQVLATVEETTRQRRRLLLDLDACLSAGRALHAAARDRLVTDFVGFVAALFDDIAATTDKNTRIARVKRLETWYDDPELQQLYREWATRFVRELEEWQDATTARLEARLTSVAFRSAFPETGRDLDVDHLTPEEGPALSVAAEGAKGLARSASKAPKETVIKVAHRLGHKFKPWGATKLTTKVNKAGGAFGVAFGALELYSVWKSLETADAAEQFASERRSAALGQVRDAVEDFLASTDPEAPGASLRESLDQVQRARDHEAGELDSDQQQAAVLARQIDRCQQQMRDALTRLEMSKS